MIIMRFVKLCTLFCAAWFVIGLKSSRPKTPTVKFDRGDDEHCGAKCRQANCGLAARAMIPLLPQAGQKERKRA
jgi:hypothetical protein